MPYVVHNVGDTLNTTIKNNTLKGERWYYNRKNDIKGQ